MSKTFSEARPSTSPHASSAANTFCTSVARSALYHRSKTKVVTHRLLSYRFRAFSCERSRLQRDKSSRGLPAEK